MAKLEGQKIADSYEQLLHTDRDGGGNGTTHVAVKDGKNDNTFALTLATDAVMITSTNRLEFGDDASYIHQSADGILDLVSDTEIELNATTIDVNGTVDISGKLGIGSPASVNADSMLHIKGTDNTGIFFEDDDDNQDWRLTTSTVMQFYDVTNSREMLRLGTAESVFNEGSADLDFRIESNDNANMFFVDGGNNKIGIGTTSPDGSLHVHTATAGSIDARSDADDLVVENSAHGGISILTPDDQFSNLMFGSPSDSRGAVLDYSHSTKVLNIGSDVASGQVVFKVASSTEAMRIDASGNVGIGLAPVANRLHLHEPDSTQVFAHFTNTTTGTTHNDGLLVGVDGDEQANIWNRENTATLFATNDTERMRIDASGNIGIGVVPEATQSDYDSLQIGGNANITSYGTQGASGQVDFGHNYYFSAAGTDKYISTDEATQFRQSSGNFIFRSAQSGSADAAITFTQIAKFDINSRISLSNNDGNAGNCTFFGYLTGATNGGGGDRNCAFGHQALTANSAGDDNTVYGYQAGLVAGTSGAAINNTLIGSGSGKAIDTADYNTCLGYASGDTITTGNFNIAIGNSTDVSASGATNQIVIGAGATGVADNTVTLGSGDVTDVYMAQDSGAKVHCLDVKPTGGGALKENMINNSDFAVWSNSTPETLGSDLVTNGAFSSDASGWTAVRATLSSVSGGQSGNCLSISRDSGGDQSAYQNFTTSAVVGQLYKATVYVKDGTASSQQFHLQIYSGSEYRRTISTTTSSWVQHTVYMTATAATVGITLRKNTSDAGTILFDTATAHEVSIGCVAADSLMADGWAKDNVNDCYRIYGDSTYNKDGSPYSLKVNFGSGNEIFYPRGNIQSDPTWWKRFIGQTVTFGCWVHSSAATLVKLGDTDGESSATHTGGGGWEWLEVTRTCDSSIAYFRVIFRAAGTETAYFTQPILALGHSIGSGGYTKPINEVVYPEEVIKILSLDNKTGANGFSDVSDTPIDLQADTEGKLPYNARAINLSVSANDSASASGAGLIYFTGLNGDKAELICRPHGKTNDTVEDANAEIVLKDMYTSNGAGGNLNYVIDASGSNTFDVTQAYINKVILK